MTSERSIACLGCGGIVPDIDGPSHRYLLASPGCWAAYTELPGGALADVDLPDPHGSLTVDAYAVQHPGVPNPQATQSVWVHLMTLYLALERGWPTSQLVRVRRLGIETSADPAWLEPPPGMGPVTAIDVATARPADVPETVRSWVDGAWAAWSPHHEAARRTADALVTCLG